MNKQIRNSIESAMADILSAQQNIDEARTAADQAGELVISIIKRIDSGEMNIYSLRVALEPVYSLLCKVRRS